MMVIRHSNPAASPLELVWEKLSFKAIVFKQHAGGDFNSICLIKFSNVFQTCILQNGNCKTTLSKRANLLLGIAVEKNATVLPSRSSKSNGIKKRSFLNG